MLIYDGVGNVFHTTDVLEKPGLIVQYKLIAINGAGFGVSLVKQIELPFSSPAEVPLVQTQVLGPTSLRVNWSFSSDENLSKEAEFSFKVVLEEVMVPESGFSSTDSALKRSRRSTEEGKPSFSVKTGNKVDHGVLEENPALFTF